MLSNVTLYTVIKIFLFLGCPCSSVGKESAYIMQETHIRFPGQEDPLEKEMATHSSILAWRIPWTCSLPGSSVHGVARVGHNLATKPPPPPPITLGVIPPKKVIQKKKKIITLCSGSLLPWGSEVGLNDSFRSRTVTLSPSPLTLASSPCPMPSEKQSIITWIIIGLMNQWLVCPGKLFSLSK